MVMGQFVTTYRKDFLWPYVATLGTKPLPDPLSPKQRLQACSCHQLSKVRPTDEQIIGPEALFQDEWSKSGPTGPLLEPKTITARVSPPPQSDISKDNQPSVFMRKLQEKYPFIYECLKTAPPDDIIARVTKDRLASTYQVDFCNKREFPSDPYDELLRLAGVPGLPPCIEPIKLPGDPCRPGQKISAKRNSQFTKEQGQGEDRTKKRKEVPLGSCRGGAFTVSEGATEYQDTHSRLGIFIIRDGIHDPSRRSKIESFGNNPS